MKTKKKAVPAKKANARLDRVFLEAIRNTSKGSKSWYDKLRPSDKALADTIKRECVSGDYQHLSSEAVAKAISKEFKIEVSGQAVRSWLRRQ